MTHMHGPARRLGEPTAEAKLFEPVRMLISTLLPDDRLTATLPEFRTEHGVVDLAGFVFDAQRLVDRLSAGPLLRGRLAAEVAVAIVHGARRRATLMERLDLNERSVSRAINTLRVAGLVTEIGDRLSINQLVTQLPLVKAIAVELKVSHWRDALRQGVQHAMFADESYVAMDLSFFRRYGPNSQMLKERGVGLIGVDVRSATAVVLQQAKSIRRTDPSHRLMASEEAIRRILDRSGELG